MERFYANLGYEFKDIKLLNQALTHPSVMQDRDIIDHKVDYERLEFLGDAVLGLIITEFLINQYPDEEEGYLAKRRAALVCGEAISNIAKELNLGSYLIMAEGEDNCGGRENLGTLENCLEAVIGALYLDGGLSVVRDFVYKYWTPLATLMTVPPKDPKTALQEWAQKLGKPIPLYKTVHTEGPSHSPKFTVEVYVDGLQSMVAVASSKRKAERIAAKNLLEFIDTIDNDSK